MLDSLYIELFELVQLENHCNKKLEIVETDML